MLRLADTSVRMYRRKDGRVSVRLRSYLMVSTNVGFRLAAYRRSISCRLQFPDGKEIDFGSVAFTESVEAEYKLNTMVHGVWAHGITDIPKIQDTVATLRLDYHVSFTGHPEEEPSHFEVVVPVLKRRPAYGRS